MLPYGTSVTRSGLPHGVVGLVHAGDTGGAAALFCSRCQSGVTRAATCSAAGHPDVSVVLKGASPGCRWRVSNEKDEAGSSVAS